MLKCQSSQRQCKAPRFATGFARRCAAVLHVRQTHVQCRRIQSGDRSAPPAAQACTGVGVQEVAAGAAVFSAAAGAAYTGTGLANVACGNSGAPSKSLLLTVVPPMPRARAAAVCLMRRLPHGASSCLLPAAITAHTLSSSAVASTVKTHGLVQFQRGSSR